jgi:hypothetical protein
LGCGDEDDRDVLEPGMLANHRRQLEAVQLGHAHVGQDDRDLPFQDLLECLFRRTDCDEVFAQLAQDRLVAEEFGWLVVDEEDVDRLVRTHVAATLLTVELPAQCTQQPLGDDRLAIFERLGGAGIFDVPPAPFEWSLGDGSLP